MQQNVLSETDMDKKFPCYFLVYFLSIHVCIVNTHTEERGEPVVNDEPGRRRVTVGH